MNLNQGSHHWGGPNCRVGFPFEDGSITTSGGVRQTACADALPVASCVTTCCSRHSISQIVWLSIRYFSGWWFQPSWKMLVNGKDYPMYYGKIKNVPNHQPVFATFWHPISHIYSDMKNQGNSLAVYVTFFMAFFVTCDLVFYLAFCLTG